MRYSGFVLGQGVSDLSGSLAFSTAATAASHVGSYTVTASGLSSSDYAISYVDGALNVTAAALTGEPLVAATIGCSGCGRFCGTVCGTLNIAKMASNVVTD